MNKKYFQQDKISVGFIVGLGTIVVTALLLTVGLLIAGEPIDAHLRWYACVFIPLILLTRYYVKQQLNTVTKTLFVVFFVSFIAFMFLLFSTHQITLNS